MMAEIIQYLLRFMIGEHLTDDISSYVGYSSDKSCYSNFKVVIVPCNFFDDGIYGTHHTEPSLPLEAIEGVPFLFGSPEVERYKDTIVVHADLVASAFFLISRYEEMLHRDKRDEHGRFPGRESLPRRAGFIDRPIIEEYGRLLRKWLNDSGVKTEELIPFVRNINLTHDVDAPFFCRTWRNVARQVMSGKSPAAAIRDKNRSLEQDEYYTFPWMLEQDKKLQQEVGEERCRSFMFFKAGGNTKQDKPYYDLYGDDVGALFDLCRKYKATVGLHSSYQAGINPSLILSEKKYLEEAFKAEIVHNRHHFLASREPEDMEYLEKAGITDDYTLGYADIAGFRLGTSKPVRYINPVNRKMSPSLLLHPLTIMDSTLDELKYMNLTADRAEEYCDRLINNIRNVNGELTLLWHNTSVIERKGYLRDLYAKLIKKLK